jgi:hypothetical protein
MTISISAEIRESFCRTARKSDRHLRETARIFAYLRELESDIQDRRIAQEFWNIRDSASGWLESCRTLPSGTPIWRLYPQHRHAIALLALQNGEICVLQICCRRELETVERALSGA